MRAKLACSRLWENPLPNAYVRCAVLAALLLGVISSPAHSAITVSDSGRWTPSKTWDGTAVHMALLANHSGGSIHSFVVWWYGIGHHESLFEGIWTWKPWESTCDVYPDSSLGLWDYLTFPDSDQVFCSSESQLGDGSLLVAGGTQAGTENGKRHAWRFSPLDLHWSPCDSMGAPRWYPTSTTLADGRALVTSGSSQEQLLLWGGKVNSDSTPRDSAFLRLGLSGNGTWLADVRTSSTADWPEAREEHTFVYWPWASKSYLFGGKVAGGSFKDELRTFVQAPNVRGSDFDFSWGLASDFDGRPPARAEHACVAGPDTGSFFVLGGLRRDESNQLFVSSDVWRLTKAYTGAYDWNQVHILASQESPGPRYGHVAVYDSAFHRILLFGGRSTVNGGPADNELWALNLSATSRDTATWEKLTPLGSERPAARYDHALGVDMRFWDGEAFLFGGKLSGGTLANDVWMLEIDEGSGDVAWTRISDLSGTPPSPRSNHTAAFDARTHRLFIHGGADASGTTDDTVYVAKLEAHAMGEQRTWSNFSRHGATALNGHAAILLHDWMFERTPEIFDPATLSFTQATGATRLQEWYPQGFVTPPNGDVFFSGPADTALYFRIGSLAWDYSAGNVFVTTGFKGGSAVMFRPGKVMKCGTRDTDPIGSSSVGTTKWIDLTAGSPAWTSSADSMLGRVNHNLTLLPNGRVLATGGLGVNDDGQNINPVRKPEVWDPEWPAGQGHWYGADTLAANPLVRGYHSTALLLPDGRILTAGGNNHPDSIKANVYCPPYLFNANGTLATRPVINDVLQHIHYGRKFSLCMPYNTTPSSICLIRGAAVTHGFDQNQRYVPLSFTMPEDDIGCRAVITAPADSFIAPPGDYMIFILNSSGVPAVAKWVRLGMEWEAADGGVPGTIGDFAPEVITSSSITLTWSAPGDDGFSGVASQYDLRDSTVAMNSSNFYSATPVPNTPVPVCPNDLQSYTLTGLTKCKWYYFGIKTSDDFESLSVLSTCGARTMCSLGGGSFATDAGDRIDATGARADSRRIAGFAAAAPSATAAENAAPGTVLVADFARDGTAVRWTFHREARSEIQGIGEPDGSDVLIQVHDPEVGWRTRTRVAGLDFPAGIAALVRPGRVLFPGDATLDRVSASLDGYALAAGGGAAEGTTSAVEPAAESLEAALSAGDSLSFEYTTDSPEPDERCFFYVNGTSSASALSAARIAPVSLIAPLVFALQPNRPNPFEQTTRIRFTMPDAADVRLQVFDTQGRRVRVLAHRRFEAGEHEVEWDRSSTSGARTNPGVYYYELTAGSRHARRKMVVLP